ncbi:MAG: hypothetical protein RRZ83_03865 [Alistipes sp.]
MIISVTPELYREMADRLREAIRVSDYFSGTILYAQEDVESRFTASLIVYQRAVNAPDGKFCEITDLVPVWWEFHTLVAGEEVINDFEFSELKSYIL